MRRQPSLTATSGASFGWSDGSDFGSTRAGASGSTDWNLAAPGMPNVEVAGLTIVPGARRLYAATHGLSAWLLNLP